MATADEFLVRLEKKQLIVKERERIEEVFGVKLKFGNIVRNPAGQWLVLDGHQSQRQAAKEYIKCLCNPEETMTIPYPPELDSVVTSPQVHRSLEKNSHAAIRFTGDNQAYIMGSTLGVVMAVSAFEDLISTFRESTQTLNDSDPIASYHSSNSVKLDAALKNQLSLQGDLDYTCDDNMPDVVKRVILGWLVEDNKDDKGEHDGETVGGDKIDLTKEDSQDDDDITEVEHYKSDKNQTQIVQASKVPPKIKKKLQAKAKGDEGMDVSFVDLTQDSPSVPMKAGRVPLAVKNPPNFRRDVDLPSDDSGVASFASQDRKHYVELLAYANKNGYTALEVDDAFADFGSILPMPEFLQVLHARRLENVKEQERRSPSEITQVMANVGIAAEAIGDGLGKDPIVATPTFKKIMDRGQRAPVRRECSTSKTLPATATEYSMRGSAEDRQKILKDKYDREQKELAAKANTNADKDLPVRLSRWDKSPATYARQLSQRREGGLFAQAQGGSASSQLPVDGVSNVEHAMHNVNDWVTIVPKPREPRSQEIKKHGRDELGPAGTAVKFSRSPSPKRINLDGKSSKGVPVQSDCNTLSREFELSPSIHDARAGENSGPRKLRYIVIDGSNVAMSHTNGKVFSCRGIALCVDYFLKRGHREITVFVPQYRRKMPSPTNNIKDQHILEELNNRNYLTFTPSRRLEQQRKNIVCYDDRFIVRLAVATDGIIVSNDNYRDLMGDSLEFKRKIENGLLMYTFVGDLFMPPDDPLGRYGPNLDQFLSKPDPRNVLNRGALNPKTRTNGAPQQLNRPYQPIPNQWNPAPYTHPSVLQNAPYAGAVQQGNQRTMGQQYGKQASRPTGQIPRPRDQIDGLVHGQQHFGAMGPAHGHHQQPDRGKDLGPGVRSKKETTALRKQLQSIFLKSEQRIEKILQNHPQEQDLNKLSSYLLDSM